jgi:DNA-binding transcriptional ArsR family regulator
LTVCRQATILKSVLDQSVDLDRVFQALSDPGRRSMLERLALGPATVSALAEPMPLSLAAVVQHVQVLEACGLIRTEKVGRQRTCRIDAGAARTAERWLADRRALWERKLDNLGHYLSDVDGAGRRRPRRGRDARRAP